MENPRRVGRDFVAPEQRRLRAARLLSQGTSQAEVARQVGAHPQSVSRWVEKLKTKGLAGLKRAGRAGRKPRLHEDRVNQIEQMLQQGPDAFGYTGELWTAQRVRDVIVQQCGVKFCSSHVWWLLRQMGWRCQRPAGRRGGWAKLRKTPKNKAARSSS